MFTQFGSTAENLSKASTMVFRIGTDAHLYDDPDDVSISPLLDSKFDSEKCEALKRLLALIAQGLDVSNYFPQVVKNVASQRPNEALLSINIFQRDLGDQNPLVRAWALRTMAGIRLHVISPLVLVAVRKCARDPSVYVRKCAANALPKLHDLRLEENATSIIEIIGILLNDNSPGVVGAAAAAFASICPNNLPLIGRNYTRLCEILPDVEEWGQIILIEILLRYVIAKQGLAKESIMASLCPQDEKSDSDPDSNYLEKKKKYEVFSGVNEPELLAMVSRSYLAGQDKYLSNSTTVDVTSSEVDSSRFVSSKSDADLKILLQCTSPLLWSRNSAVVLAAAGVHWIMAPKEDIFKIVKPLLFLLRSSDASKYVVYSLLFQQYYENIKGSRFLQLTQVLCNIQVFTKVMPSLFAPNFEDFFINTSDAYQVKSLKLEILSSIATDESISFIFQELQDYVRDPDRRFAADTVAAIGLCAKRNPQVANTCLEGLLALTSPKSINSTSGSMDDDAVLIQAITSIKDIIKQDPSTHDKAIIYLIRNLDAIKVPVARAIIVWILGEYNSIGNTIPKMVPIILRFLARGFPSESIETKHQILNAAVKVVLNSKGEDFDTAKSILSYVLELAKFDLNYDVRDRSRVLGKLMSCYVSEAQTPENNETTVLLTKHIFGENIKSSNEMMNNRFYLPGSLSQIVLHAAPGYEPLPEPCSLTHVDFEVENSDVVDSGSLNEEGSFDDDSEGSITTDNTHESETESEVDDNTDSLINLSDVGNTQKETGFDSGELMSKGALESWLDENPSSSQNVTGMESVNERNSSARISIGDISGRVKPKTYTLLEPAYGNGLKAVYKYSTDPSTVSPSLVSVEVSFENCSGDQITKISLSDEDSDTNSELQMEEITTLEPGQTTKRIIHVQFHHHLLPLKLNLWCNDKKHLVKLRPDIGYFIKPLPMDINVFLHKESQLPGMFEYSRSCCFTDHLEEVGNEKEEVGDGKIMKDSFLVICESLALKMMSNANVYLVCVNMPVDAKLNDVSGVCLRFSSEILSNSIPCLISVTLDGKCFQPLNASVKINCEETVFGMNLLNRIVNFLGDPPPVTVSS
uniref:AP-3 complex subunit beta n=1 Tax=Lactuca sativa TaxID=4236 RepID=A0A9R1UU16_LACSA|nr:hypothetical protein LSAT_V11C800395210 [Lactuca sativa]